METMHFVQVVLLSIGCAALVWAVGCRVYSMLRETAEAEADAKYAAMYRNADISVNIDIQLIDERS